MTREEMEALATSMAPIVALEVVREVIGRIGAQHEREFLDASELARVLGVERDWIYEHRDQLGAIRLGDGPRPRLRFEVDRAVAAFRDLWSERRVVPLRDGPQAPVPRPRRSRGRRR